MVCTRTFVSTALVAMVFCLAGCCRQIGEGDPAGHGESSGLSTAEFKARMTSAQDAALHWLADHQNSNGHWSATGFQHDSIRLKRPNPAAVTHNVDFRSEMEEMWGTGNQDTGHDSFNSGLTGLALLAFVLDGYTHRAGKFQRNVGRAAKFIMESQDAEGCFGARDDDEFVYSHAICTWALSELYEMTMSPTLKSRAQKGVDFIVRCQNPGMGWRYGIQPRENDSSVTVWMVMALRAAQTAGLQADYAAVFGGANAWFDKATGKTKDGTIRTGYDRPGGTNARLARATKYHSNAAMDAASVFTRISTRARDADDELVQHQSRLINADLPGWYIDGDEAKGPWKIDYTYWFLGSRAIYQVGGDHWTKWDRALVVPVLMKYQRGWHPKDVAMFGPGVATGEFHLPSGEENPASGRFILDEHGSWDPVDAWGSVGGRVYATAINALTLSQSHIYARKRELDAAD